MFITYLSLGSNLGDRRENLRQASEFIAEQIGSVESSSSVYETAAWGMEDQPDFLNQVVAVATALTPSELLIKTQEIELVLGRRRLQKWGARTMDIDILLYEKRIINTAELTVPHQYLHERRFCLEPLNEIAPDVQHPILNCTIAELLANLSDSLLVKKLT